MPIQFKEEQAFIRLVFSGRITALDLLGALARLYAMELLRKHVPDRLTDLTGVTASDIRAEDIQAAANLRRKHRFPNRFRSAIVADKPALFGYARMFQILNDHPDITIQIFTDMAAAEAWLATPP